MPIGNLSALNAKTKTISNVVRCQTLLCMGCPGLPKQFPLSEVCGWPGWRPRASEKAPGRIRAMAKELEGFGTGLVERFRLQ